VTLGRGIIRDEEPLNLEKFRFMGAEAYVFLPDEELIARFPHYEVSGIDVLATEQRRLHRRGASYRHYRFDKLEWQARKVHATAEAIDMLPQSLYDDIEILSHQLEAGMCTQSTQKKILFTVAEDPGAQAILAFGTIVRGGEVNGVVKTS
jgi:hypothetical protein